MSIAQVVEIGRDLLYTALLLALPTLGASLLVGLLVSVLQAITSIQEQTLSFVPRLLAVGLVLVLAMPWTMQLAIHFTMRMLERAAEVGR
ncbi:MAG TPA: flagellar biosynthetic protein FliQ [Gemmataceae bacterium]|nr:flagellar biosynthetic protein FliQ [Gemmataceae bacterium]